MNGMLDHHTHYYGSDISLLRLQLNKFLNHPFGSNIGGAMLVTYKGGL